MEHYGPLLYGHISARSLIGCGQDFLVMSGHYPLGVQGIQLFRERLSEKVHVTIPKGILGGFEFTVLQRNLKELARKAMKMCLRVLTESNKEGLTATVVRNSVSIISHITFQIVACTFFPTTFLEIAVCKLCLTSIVDIHVMVN